MRRFLQRVLRHSDAEAVIDIEINCHHNYTTREKHFGREVWLTRKGAIDAHEGV